MICIVCMLSQQKIPKLKSCMVDVEHFWVFHWKYLWKVLSPQLRQLTAQHNWVSVWTRVHHLGLSAHMSCSLASLSPRVQVHNYCLHFRASEAARSMQWRTIRILELIQKTLIKNPVRNHRQIVWCTMQTNHALFA